MFEQQPKYLEENWFGSIFLPEARGGALGEDFVAAHFQILGVKKYYNASSLEKESEILVVNDDVVHWTTSLVDSDDRMTW